MKAIRQPLHRLFDIVGYVVDERVGIIKQVGELPKEAGAPDFFHFYAKACDTRAFCGQQNFPDAGGASSERSAAIAKAIGEAVERYCAAIYIAGELPFSSFETATFPCVSPAEFALYSDRQYAQPAFPFVPFQNDTRVHWVQACDLATGEPCYVPAVMVYVPYHYDHANEELPFAQPISTGLACHTSATTAVISALCEVIERDAFTIAWQAEMGMPRLLLDTLSDSNRDLVRRFELTRNSVSLFNITMDHGVPSILAVLSNKCADSPALVFAAASDLDPERAVRKSLEELAHTRRLAQEFRITLPRLMPTNGFDSLVSQDDHVHLYCDPDNAFLADFIFGSDEVMRFSDIQKLSTGNTKEDLQTLVSRIEKLRHRALVVDVTTPDVQELGLTVVRAIIPGFHPLCMGHPYRALGGTRLWEVPQKLGYKGISRDSGDNPAPHPYP